MFPLPSILPPWTVTMRFPRRRLRSSVLLILAPSSRADEPPAHRGIDRRVVATPPEKPAVSPEKTEPARPQPKPGELQIATFGGGCFWCIEAVFDQVPGVRMAVSGYAGGVVPPPSYEMVSTGDDRACRGCSGRFRAGRCLL